MLLMNFASLKEKRGSLLERHKIMKHSLEELKNSEYCPLCKRKLDNVDNTAQIKEKEKEIDAIVSEGLEVGKKISTLEREVELMKNDRDAYNRKSQLTVKKSALEVNVERLRNEYKENKALKKEYEKNSEAIDKNNEIDIQIRNTEFFINDKRKAKS